MGYSLNEANAMTFNEYNFLYYGYAARCQQELLGARKIIATIVNWSGKITDKNINEEEIFSLPLVDIVVTKPKVTTKKEALAIFKSFL